MAVDVLTSLAILESGLVVRLVDTGTHLKLRFRLCLSYKYRRFRRVLHTGVLGCIGLCEKFSV